MTKDDLRFAKVVTDSFDRDHILIAGRLVGLSAPDAENNALVDLFVSYFRNPNDDMGEGSVCAAQSAAVAVS